MISNRKVSIIVPVYNSEKYLDRSIQSIIDQTHQNLEIILVNDGSTDSSLTICREKESTDPRIIVIDKPHNGVASTRNEGLNHCTGDYIGFVDSDDYIAKEMYEELVKSLETSQADIAECGHFVVDDKNNIIQKYPLKKSLIKGSYNCSKHFLSMDNSRTYCCNKLYSKKLFDNLRFAHLIHSEDYLINVQAHYYANSKVIIDTCFYYYRKHPEDDNRKQKRELTLDSIKSGKLAIEFYDDRYKDLQVIISRYILKRIIRSYSIILKDNSEEKINLKNTLLQEYLQHYNLLKKSNFNKLSLKVFAFCPKLYYLFFPKIFSLRNKILKNNLPV